MADRPGRDHRRALTSVRSAVPVEAILGMCDVSIDRTDALTQRTSRRITELDSFRGAVVCSDDVPEARRFGRAGSELEAGVVTLVARTVIRRTCRKSTCPTSIFCIGFHLRRADDGPDDGSVSPRDRAVHTLRPTDGATRETPIPVECHFASESYDFLQVQRLALRVTNVESVQSATSSIVEAGYFAHWRATTRRTTQICTPPLQPAVGRTREEPVQ
jgi:hypothetical protein